MAKITRSRTRRSRRPIVLGILVVAAVAIVAILRRPANQRRLEAAARDARERFATWRAQDMRPGSDTLGEAASDESIPALGSVTEDIGRLPQDATGTNDAATDGVPAFEESKTPS